MDESVKAPRGAMAILNFFAAQPDFAAVAGDLSEEFQQRAERSGAAAAQRWFWREVLRNAWALTWREVRRTPLKTAGMALACLAVINFATGLFFAPYLFRQGDLLAILADPRWRAILLAVQIAAPAGIGWAGARALVGREWALAVTFTLAYVALATTPLLVAMNWWPRLPGWVILLALSANVLRVVFFTAGCLWARRGRLHTVHGVVRGN